MSNLTIYQLRAYNPKTGKWLSRDPYKERGGANLYSFVGNDSIRRIDILGLAYSASVRIVAPTVDSGNVSFDIADLGDYTDISAGQISTATTSYSDLTVACTCCPEEEESRRKTKDGISTKKNTNKNDNKPRVRTDCMTCVVTWKSTITINLRHFDGRAPILSYDGSVEEVTLDRLYGVLGHEEKHVSGMATFLTERAIVNHRFDFPPNCQNRISDVENAIRRALRDVFPNKESRNSGYQLADPHHRDPNKDDPAYRDEPVDGFHEPLDPKTPESWKEQMKKAWKAGHPDENE